MYCGTHVHFSLISVHVSKDLCRAWITAGFLITPKSVRNWTAILPAGSAERSQGRWWGDPSVSGFNWYREGDKHRQIDSQTESGKWECSREGRYWSGSWLPLRTLAFPFLPLQVIYLKAESVPVTLASCGIPCPFRHSNPENHVFWKTPLLPRGLFTEM